MAYQKQTWENAPSTNSPLNADRLNHMEDGIYNASLVANSYNESDTNAYSCDYINNNYQMNGTILWTNPNPNDAFSSQTISLSDYDFDYIDIIYNNYISRNTYEVDRVYKNYPSSEIGGTFNYSGKVYSGTRTLEITNNGSKIVFETAYGSRLDTYSFGAHNDWYVPIKIIGYKTGLFS